MAAVLALINRLLYAARHAHAVCCAKKKQKKALEALACLLALLCSALLCSPALRTARVMDLQQRAMLCMRMASSWSPVLLMTKAERVGVDDLSTWSGSLIAMEAICLLTREEKGTRKGERQQQMRKARVRRRWREDTGPLRKERARGNEM